MMLTVLALPFFLLSYILNLSMFNHLQILKKPGTKKAEASSFGFFYTIELGIKRSQCLVKCRTWAHNLA